MSIKLYMDVHVKRAVTDSLRLRGIEVLTAQEDSAAELPDAELLDRARVLGRVLFSQDIDLVIEAQRRQDLGLPFSGLVYAHQLRVTTGQCVSDLELIATFYEPEDLENRVEYLPLK